MTAESVEISAPGTYVIPLDLYLSLLTASDTDPTFALADLDVRCAHSDLPVPSCAHCRPDVRARLAADPVFAAWLDRAADNADA
jgi:hypothetical protein